MQKIANAKDLLGLNERLQYQGRPFFGSRPPLRSSGLAAGISALKCTALVWRASFHDWYDSC
ncbi:hypothetical protein, partial [Phaeobacter gallaeciensis]|uniref:hypothetical protein n=1 Tax=Phaeobacter gallaeciensis TaxID=60890 RepID=UPI003A87D3B7